MDADDLEAVSHRLRSLHESGYRPICIALKFTWERYARTGDWSESMIRSLMAAQGIVPLP